MWGTVYGDKPRTEKSITCTSYLFTTSRRLSHFALHAYLLTYRTCTAAGVVEAGTAMVAVMITLPAAMATVTAW